MRCVNTKNLLMLQSFLMFLLVVIVALGVALPYIVPPRTATNNTEIVPTAMTLSTSTPVPNGSITQWEYLSVDYAQFETFDGEVPRYEIVNAPEPYGSRFAVLLFEGCSITDSLSSYFDIEVRKCIGRNFIGREYVLSVLGADGWEMVAFDNQSSEYSYRVEMVFKRPIDLAPTQLRENQETA